LAGANKAEKVNGSSKKTSSHGLRVRLSVGALRSGHSPVRGSGHAEQLVSRGQIKEIWGAIMAGLRGEPFSIQAEPASRKALSPIGRRELEFMRSGVH
jgi:hypothetical protein